MPPCFVSHKPALLLLSESSTTGKMRRNFSLAMMLRTLRPWRTASLSAAAAEMICLSGLRPSTHAG